MLFFKCNYYCCQHYYHHHHHHQYQLIKCYTCLLQFVSSNLRIALFHSSSICVSYVCLFVLCLCVVIFLSVPCSRLRIHGRLPTPYDPVSTSCSSPSPLPTLPPSPPQPFLSPRILSLSLSPFFPPFLAPAVLVLTFSLSHDA